MSVVDRLLIWNGEGESGEGPGDPLVVYPVAKAPRSIQIGGNCVHHDMINHSR